MRASVPVHTCASAHAHTSRRMPLPGCTRSLGTARGRSSTTYCTSSSPAQHVSQSHAHLHGVCACACSVSVCVHACAHACVCSVSACVHVCRCSHTPTRACMRACTHVCSHVACARKQGCTHLQPASPDPPAPRTPLPRAGAPWGLDDEGKFFVGCATMLTVSASISDTLVLGSSYKCGHGQVRVSVASNADKFGERCEQR